MHIRVLDLDGSIGEQTAVTDRFRPAEHDLRAWGPRVRMACRHGRFARFEAALSALLDRAAEAAPAITLYGSGDFHHVSLALLRRIEQPFNLLVVDKHPDWMRGIPFLHCGTWVYHAARLPQVRQIYHVGGDLDFDNAFRWLAPWRLLRAGKIRVLPAIRRFARGGWAGIPHTSVRPEPGAWTSLPRLQELLHPFRADLRRWPLYISLDKDVLCPGDAVVNWDSGHLALPEVEMIMEAFLEAARGMLVGMDILGDWSRPLLSGLFRRWLHLTEHPRLAVDPEIAIEKNARTNMLLLRSLQDQLERLQPVPLRVAA